MTSIDIFTALAETISLAEKILKNNNMLSTQDRQKMNAIKGGLTTYRSIAFGLREYTVNDLTAPK